MGFNKVIEENKSKGLLARQEDGEEACNKKPKILNDK
tara:strand:- start:697 stop:807 length:111 start_codon:yes stop_codon:yes gene_type:complete